MTSNLPEVKTSLTEIHINLTSSEGINIDKKVKPETPTSENYIKSISQTDVLDHGGILGTAAAFKSDVREPLIGCSLSEFACRNGKCIPISKYCDKINDCNDYSDEPKLCSRKLNTLNI